MSNDGDFEPLITALTDEVSKLNGTVNERNHQQELTNQKVDRAKNRQWLAISLVVILSALFIGYYFTNQASIQHDRCISGNNFRAAYIRTNTDNVEYIDTVLKKFGIDVDTMPDITGLSPDQAKQAIDAFNGIREARDAQLDHNNDPEFAQRKC